MFRYLAFAWNCRDTCRSEMADVLTRNLQSSSEPWDVAASQPGLRVFIDGLDHGPNELHLLGQQSGVVLGVLFRRNADMEDDSPSSRAKLREPEVARIVRSEGRILTEDYWGRYVALIRTATGDQTWVVRGPGSTLPCFETQHLGVHVFFSSIADCLRLRRMRFSINRRFLISRVAFSSHLAEGSAINEVEEVHPGECVRFRHSKRLKLRYWSPAELAASAAIEDSQRAAVEMRAVVRSCVHSWASCYDGILHEISGGLDSSIVLRCLTNAPSRPRVACATYYVPGGLSDERRYAAAATARFGCDLIECARDPTAIDYRRVFHANPSIDPHLSFPYLEFGDFQTAMARERRSSAISTGIGGDTLFGSDRRGYVAMDYVHRHGLNRKLLILVLQEAGFRDTSFWKALHEAVRGRRVGEVQQWRKYSNLLHQDTLSAALQGPFPWNRRPGSISPGAWRLIESLKSPTDFYNPMRPEGQPGPESIHPLISQPLIELSLRLPSYVLNDSGQNRALARRAFSTELPPEILTRQWKDRGVGFTEAMFMQNYDLVRSVLLDGILVKERYLERRSLEAALHAATLSRPNQFHAGLITDYFIVEAWLAFWTRHGANNHSGATFPPSHDCVPHTIAIP